MLLYISSYCRSVGGMWVAGPVVGHEYGWLRNICTTTNLPTLGWEHRGEDGCWYSQDNMYNIIPLSGINYRIILVLLQDNLVGLEKVKEIIKDIKNITGVD